MDWNLKATCWDFTEFGGSSSFGGSGSKGKFSVDLKLGQVDSGDNSSSKWKQPVVSKMTSSPSGSTKRARAASNGTQTVSCLVDGCSSDLSNCRDYHRRHKVCELHSKAPQVMICGQKQRFCQQCSRFHTLEEFDEGKRSCRKRLDGHNRRRRKPQPDPLSRSGRFLTSYLGTQLMPLPGHIYPSTTIVNPLWAGVVNADGDGRQYNQHQHLQLHDKQNLFLGFSPGGYKGGKQFTFMQQGEQASQEASVCQPLLRNTALSERSKGSHNLFQDRLTTQDSDCALSLLSAPNTQTSGIRLSQMVQPLVQSLGPSFHNHNLEPMEAVLVSSGRNVNVDCAGIFHTGLAGSSADEAPQTVPFQWE